MRLSIYDQQQQIMVFITFKISRVVWFHQMVSRRSIRLPLLTVSDTITAQQQRAQDIHIPHLPYDHDVTLQSADYLQWYCTEMCCVAE